MRMDECTMLQRIEILRAKLAEMADTSAGLSDELLVNCSRRLDEYVVAVQRFRLAACRAAGWPYAYGAKTADETAPALAYAGSPA